MSLIIPKQIDDKSFEIFGRKFPAFNIEVNSANYQFCAMLMFEDGSMWRVWIDWWPGWKMNLMEFRYNSDNTEIQIIECLSWKAFFDAYDHKVKPRYLCPAPGQDVNGFVNNFYENEPRKSDA